MKTLVIAEKPSVASDIVKAISQVHGPFTKHEDHHESDTHIVTSAIGHLVEIRIPDEFEAKTGKWNFKNLPVLPPRFDLKPIEKTKSRLNAVVKLAKRKDVSVLINACDAGREGELIFRLIEQYAGGAKGTLGKPIKRLWLQSMTPQAIRDGFNNLRSEEQMQGLADAARSRSEADWIVGINGTRAMTAFNSREGGFFLTTVGRVQTPTLSIVVDRENKIKKHIARDYWEVHATFETPNGSYQGKWFDPKHKKTEDPEVKADRVWEKPTAEKIVDNTIKGNGLVQVTDESKPSSKASPQLFDLTTLQREANSKFGLSAKNTLSIAQALYEKHKVLTYPRTDSRYLTEDYISVARTTFQSLAIGHQYLGIHAKTLLDNNYLKMTKRVFDNTKVQDHFAIIPTGTIPAGLNEYELKIYDLIAKRFMAVFYPNAEFLITNRTTVVGGQSYHTTGKVLVKPGWLAIYGKEADSEDDGDKTQSIVAVGHADKVGVSQAAPKDLQTKPPARYSEASLLGAMEGASKEIESGEIKEALQEKGLGTPATRAATIEGLISESYVVRDGKDMNPTAKAFQLMTLLKGLDVQELTRADLTGEWEHKLSLIEKGKLSRSEFMNGINDMTTRMVDKAREFNRETIPGDYTTLQSKCPCCSGVVKESYRSYGCSCGFYITKAPAGRIFEVAEVEQLIQNKRIGPLMGFRSKSGFAFKSEVLLVPDEKHQGLLKMSFDFGDEGKQSEGAVDFTGKASVGKCPKCSSPVYEHGKQWVCSHAVETAEAPAATCDFKTSKTILQYTITEEEIKTILSGGKTPLIKGFISNRTQRPFSAILYWDDKNKRINFEFAPREPGKEGGFKKFNKFKPKDSGAKGKVDVSKANKAW